MTKELEWLEQFVTKYRTLRGNIAVAGRSIMKLRHDSNPRLGREHMLDKLHSYHDLLSKLEPMLEEFFYDAFINMVKPAALMKKYRISRASVYRWKHRIAVILYVMEHPTLQKFAA